MIFWCFKHYIVHCFSITVVGLFCCFRELGIEAGVTVAPYPSGHLHPHLPHYHPPPRLHHFPIQLMVSPCSPPTAEIYAYISMNKKALICSQVWHRLMAAAPSLVSATSVISEWFVWVHELCITSYNGSSLDISSVKFEFDIFERLKLFLNIFEWHACT